MTATRKMPVPIAMPSGRVRDGHLVPDLRRLGGAGTGGATGFVCLPNGTTERYGMLALVGPGVTPEDLLARWEQHVGAVREREASLEWLRQFASELERLKVGNVVEVRYPRDGAPELRKVRESPPTEGVAQLPE
jgi:hypothetical protein